MNTTTALKCFENIVNKIRLGFYELEKFQLITNIAVMTNGLVIAFTSDFIDRAVYMIHYENNHQQYFGDSIEAKYFNVTTSADKYAAYIFSIFNTSDYPKDPDYDLRKMQVFHHFSIKSFKRFCAYFHSYQLYLNLAKAYARASLNFWQRFRTVAWKIVIPLEIFHRISITLFWT